MEDANSEMPATLGRAGIRYWQRSRPHLPSAATRCLNAPDPRRVGDWANLKKDLTG